MLKVFLLLFSIVKEHDDASTTLVGLSNCWYVSMPMSESMNLVILISTYRLLLHSFPHDIFSSMCDILHTAATTQKLVKICSTELNE